MKTSTWIYVSAFFWTGISIWQNQLAVAAVAVAGHVLFWQSHRLEVKINRLLDDRSISVRDYEFDN